MSKRFATNPKAAKTPTPIAQAKRPARRADKGAPDSASAANPSVENILTTPEESACIPEAPVVTSVADNNLPAPGSNPEPAESPETPAGSQKTMNITLNRSDATRKDARLVLFNFADGRAGQVQFLRSAFPESGVPATITMDGDFAEKTVKVAKAKLTKEERAALPKPTLAEKLAKADERAAKLRAKLAAAAPAGESAAAGM